MTRVQITRTRSEGGAECEQCDQLPVDATRERARLHAKLNGHTVHFIIEDSTTYQPEDGAA